MKKIISLVLCVLLTFSAFSILSFAAEDELKVTVATDLHLNVPAMNTADGAYVDKDFSHVPSQGQLYLESELLVDKFLDTAAQNDSEVILITGDLANGYASVRQEHEIMSSKLAEFEKTSGKRVYVVPGNHDYYARGTKVTTADFMEYYKDFGYSEAIEVDTNSASYVVDLNDDYRLIAIDSCKPGGGVNGMTEERAEWIKEQAKKAQQDGKKAIAMMHFNLLQHFIFSELLLTEAVIDKQWGIQEAFAEYNVKYCFVGHTHEHDIASYTGANGNTIYDIVTGSLNAYPCAYREVTFGDDVVIKTKYIESLDMTSLKNKISENCYNLATADFTEYAKQCAYLGILGTMENYIQPATLKKILGINSTDDPELCEVIDAIAPSLKEVVYLPMMKENETQEGMSIESMAKEIGLDLPENDFENLAELGVFLYQEHVVGDENYGLLSKEFSVLTVVMTTALSHILKNVTAEHYVMLLELLCDVLGVEVPVAFINYTGSGISKLEGIDIFVSVVLNAVLLQFTTDEAPSDINARLPGFDIEIADEEKELTFWEKIVEFFKNIFAFIVRFFNFGF